MDELRGLLARQDGVVARGQLQRVGLRPHDVRRLLRRRELVRLHPGVYVDHTGTPTWRQAAWGGVLAVWPAALSHQSALLVLEDGGRGVRPGTDVHVVVDRHRSPAAPVGVRLHHASGLEATVRWQALPPRRRPEPAALDVASEAPGEWAAVAVLAQAVQSGWTTPQRLAASLDARPSLPRRRLLRAVLRDVADGSCSVLEREYQRRVVRPHALPAGRGQVVVRGAGGPTHVRDVDLPELGLVIELDGRLFHADPVRRNRDLDRDLLSAARGASTVRLGWGQVFERACHTAAGLAEVMRAHGWQGRPRACPRCPDRPPYAGAMG